MTDYTDLLTQAEQKYGLPAGILTGQMTVESAGNPGAKSGKGALGLMQFTPATAKAYGVDTSDPASSIDGAARFMADNLKASGGNVSQALRLYQGGPNRAGWGKENAAYAGKVLSAMPGDSGDLAAMGLAPASSPQTSIDDHEDLSASGLNVPDSTGLAATQKELDALTGPASPAPSTGAADFMTHKDYLAAQQEAMKPENGGAVVDTKTGTKAPYIDPMSKEVFVGWGTSPDGKAIPNYGTPATSASSATNLSSGGNQGIQDIVGALARGGQYVESKAPVLRTLDQGINKLTGAATADQLAEQSARQKAVYDLTSGKTASGEVGRFGGNLLMGAPIIAATGGVAGAGLDAVGGGALADFAGGTAGSNLLTRGASLATNGALNGASISALTGQPIGQGAAVGAVLGPAGNIVSKGVGKLASSLAPQVDPAIASLAQKAVDMGIPIRGSQISATPTMNTLDSILARLPGSGIAADNASQRTAFTRAVGNTFGADSDSLTPQVMSDAKEAISRVYNDIAARNTLNLGTQAGGTFAQDADSLIQSANLGPQNAGRVDRLLEEVQAKIGPNGTMSGRDFKSLTSKGSMLDNATKSPDSEYAGVAKGLKASLNHELANVASPEDQAALSTANWHWKNMRTVEKLIANSPDNKINPALLQRPVSSSFSNRAYTGAGDLGDLGDIGQRLLKDQGSSNTAERGLGFNTLINAAKYGGAGLGAAIGLKSGISPLEIAGAVGTAGATFSMSKVAGAALRSPAYRNKLISAALNAHTPIPSNIGSYYLPATSLAGNRLLQGSSVAPQR